MKHFRYFMMRYLSGFAGLIILIGPAVQPATAASFAPTAGEIAVLPPFCKAKLSADSSDDKSYSGSFGSDWLHIHHYCFGLNFSNRYFKNFGNRAAQADTLKQAVNNYNYVLDHATPGFGMRAEIGTQKARLLAASNRRAEAIGVLETAIRERADYAPAYAALSDLYRDSGQKAKALTKIEQGLEHAPGDKALQRRYKKLAGKAFIPPAGADAAAVKPAPDQAPPADASAQDTAAPQAPLTTEETSEQTPAKIGAPGNPYCRFCP